MTQHYVYEIVDEQEIPFYVGITDDLKGRYSNHLHSRGINAQKEAKIQQLLLAGIEPKMRVIETWDTREQALERERYWICEYLKQGLPLTNIVIYGARKVKPQKIIYSLAPEILHDSDYQSYHPVPRLPKKLIPLEQLPSGRRLKGKLLFDYWEQYITGIGKDERDEQLEEIIQTFLSLIPSYNIRSQSDIDFFKSLCYSKRNRLEHPESFFCSVF